MYDALSFFSCLLGTVQKTANDEYRMTNVEPLTSTFDIHHSTFIILF